MNIFFTEHCPRMAARYQIDMHVSKMITESSQLLGGAVQHNGFNNAAKDVHSLAKSHLKHSSFLSVVNNISVANWLIEHAVELCKMYQESTGKLHGSEEPLLRAGFLLQAFIPDSGKDAYNGLIPACGDKMPVVSDKVELYRLFYIHDKVSFASWGKYGNERPAWFTTSDPRFDTELAWSMVEKRNKTRKKNKISREQFLAKVQEFA